MTEKQPEMEEKQPNFEDALKELESIIEELESGELSLDDSLERYERGIKALTICRNILGAAEQKIQLLTRTTGNQLKTQTFKTEDVLESEAEPEEDGEDNEIPF